MASDTEDVRPSIVAVRLLVRAHAELADVRVHRAVRQGELHVATGAACTALLPLWQFKTGQVGHEVGFPLMPPWLDCAELSLTAEVAVLADPFLERVLVFEDEVRTVEQIHDDWQVGDRREACRFAAGAVVVLVPRVDGNSEQAARPPFEAVLAAVRRLDRGGAAAGRTCTSLSCRCFSGLSDSPAAISAR